LRRGIRTRKTKKNALRKKEGAVLSVVKFSTIITLNKSNWQTKVGKNILSKIEKEGMDFRFSTERKSPNIMRVIIQKHKIIFVTRDTRNG